MEIRMVGLRRMGADRLRRLLKGGHRASLSRGCSAVVTRGAAMKDSLSDRPLLFGVTRDLAYKKIFPAFQGMLQRGRLDVPVIGAAQGVWSLVIQKRLFPLPWLNHFSDRQGVEDGHMNVIGIGGRAVGACVQRDIPGAILPAEFSEAPRRVRPFAEVVSLKPEITRSKS